MSAQLAGRFRKQPVEVEALQWLGDDEGEHTDTVCTWASDEQSRASKWVTSLFMPLPSDDADDVLGRGEVVDRIGAGYSAVVYDRLHETWVNVATNDWIIRGTKGELYPCRAEVFAEIYSPVPELAGAGLLLVPTGIKAMAGQFNPDGDPITFAQELAESMMVPLVDRDDASSMVPLVAEVAVEPSGRAVSAPDPVREGIVPALTASPRPAVVSALTVRVTLVAASVGAVAAAIISAIGHL